jgi:hypothetical protein
MKKFHVVYSTKIYYGVVVEAEDEIAAANLVEQGLTSVITKAERMLKHNKLQSMPEVHSVQEWN